MTEKQASYEKTLNLPRTDFPMKAGLAQKEPQIRKRWDEMNLYEMLRKARAGAPRYVLHDGPPYANGDVHVGTGQNKILKDMVVKFQSMRGRWTPYVPGWDCHGLPIEKKVLAELGPGAESTPPHEIRRRCREFAEKYLDVQRRQFRSLGCFGDWDRPYRTMDPSYETAILETFELLWEKGHVYRGLKPIHWCVVDRTALAFAELEYKEKQSDSIYVRFPLVCDVRAAFPDAPKDAADLIVWTTTPWTLPADLAVAVHPTVDYALVEYSRGLGIVSESLVEKLGPVLGIARVVAKARGEKLAALKYRHPLFDWQLPVVMARYVTLGDGTGLVHTAPGHGQEDFQTGVEYGLKILNPVGPDGRFTAEAGRYQGQNIFKANDVICGDLDQAGLLLHRSRITHSYPHCWRCKQPVIFRATEQWFIGVDVHRGRERALEAVSKTKWIPAWGETRIRSMLEERPDWCVSRQRNWGVPIPGLYCESCGELHVSRESLAAVKEMFRRHGADGWFRLETREFLPPTLACAKCGGRTFRKETDIFDVWFESGCSHRAVVMQHPDLQFPADLYLEGTDQHRGWFQVSLLASLLSNGQAPFRTVVTHGFMIDPETGDKISKSRRDYLTPVDQIVASEGADLLRLWLASINFTDDMPYSTEILRSRQEPYRRIRNTFRYLLGNTFDFDPSKDAVPPEKLRPLDLYVLRQLDALIRDVTVHFEEFEFYKAYHKLYTFADTTLSALYFDVLKDRLYTYPPGSVERRSGQTALHAALSALVRMFAPILAHTCEEVWGHMKGTREPSVHLALWPEPSGAADPVRVEFERLVKIRDEVNRCLEQLRKEGKIGKPNEAVVQIDAPPAEHELLSAHRDGLEELFIVSGVSLTRGESLRVTASPSPHPRCERCWRRVESVGRDSGHPDLCFRCVQAL
jgi:isoleucyl-tRNA synthetase